MKIDNSPKKARFDENAIDSALQKINENVAKELKIHFVYAGWSYHEYKLRSMILNGMKKHKIKSVMMTRIDLWKGNILAKEEMESYCKGEKDRKDSVNDDLESFFENLRLGKEPDEEVSTYFLPQLTDEEMELVKTRETNFYYNFVDIFYSEPDPVIHDEKIYFHGRSHRRTFVIETSCLDNCCNCSFQLKHF